MYMYGTLLSSEVSASGDSRRPTSKRGTVGATTRRRETTTLLSYPPSADLTNTSSAGPGMSKTYSKLVAEVPDGFVDAWLTGHGEDSP